MDWKTLLNSLQKINLGGQVRQTDEMGMKRAPDTTILFVQIINKEVLNGLVNYLQKTVGIVSRNDA